MRPDTKTKRYNWKRRAFDMVDTVKASTARQFLEENKIRATAQSARLNPAMTRAEAWDVLMNSVKDLEGDAPIHYRIYRNILREFGGKR